MAHTVELPQLPDGRTYITRKMLLDEPEVLAFYERTKNSWHEDPTYDIWVMFPSIDKKPRAVDENGEEL